MITTPMEQWSLDFVYFVSLSQTSTRYICPVLSNCTTNKLNMITFNHCHFLVWVTLIPGFLKTTGAWISFWWIQSWAKPNMRSLCNQNNYRKENLERTKSVASCSVFFSLFSLFVITSVWLWQLHSSSAVTAQKSSESKCLEVNLLICVFVINNLSLWLAC